MSEGMTLTLVWTCQSCGWHATIDAPGFAGDGWDHFDGDSRCGPLGARRATASERTVNPAVEAALLAIRDAQNYLAAAQERLRGGVPHAEAADGVRARTEWAEVAARRASEAMLRLVVTGAAP